MSRPGTKRGVGIPSNPNAGHATTMTRYPYQRIVDIIARAKAEGGWTEPKPAKPTKPRTCKHCGREIAGANLARSGSGSPRCRECHNANKRAQYHAKRAKQ